MATILVVDDVPENRALLISVLGWSGHRLVEAANGREALDVLADQSVDLVITDLLMPEMDGFELARRLVTRTDRPIKVLFYSASYNARDAMKLGGQCGVLGLIAKPAEPEAILAAVDRALETPVAPQPSPSPDFERDHVQIVNARATEAILQKRAATDRLLRLEAFGAELLAAKGPSEAARALCVAAREMVLAADAAVGLYPTDGAPLGFAVRGVLGGNVFERTGFACDAELEVPSAVEGAAARTLIDRLGLDAGPAHDALAIPIDTPARRHGWLCVASKIGGSSFTVEDGEVLAALVAQTAIACENAYRLERMTVHARELTDEIAERERIEAVLRDTETKTKFALESAHVGLWEVDLATQAVTYGLSTSALPGISPDGLPRTYADFLAMVVPDDRTRMQTAFEAAKATGEDIHIEFRITTPGAIAQWVESKAHVVCDDHGVPVSLVGISADITERKMLEAQLRESQKMEAIGQLAGGVAHDFNNILTAIVGYSDLLLKTLSGESERADAGEIRKAADRATALTRQLLAFSRRQMLQPAVVDLSLLVDGVAPMLRRLIGEDIELRTRAAKALRRIRVDPGQFEQVLLNLVVNARDAMPKGGRVSIDLANIDLDADYCAAHPDTTPGPHVVMTVTDTGTGIDAATIKHIFEPFFTTKPKDQGTGLGLSMAYGVVKQSGGHIWVYSEPGNGTVFKVYVPETVALQVAVPGELPEPAPEGGHETVLLAEDEPAVRVFARTVLRRFGYHVIEAADGAAALALMGNEPVDLLLTDVVMPGSNGPELHAAMAESMPSLKVLFMSGYPGDAMMSRGFDEGAPLLEKPFTGDVLARRVRAVLDGRAA